MSTLKYLRGPYAIEWRKKKASTAITANTFVARSAAGLITAATSTSTEIFGLSLRTVASTDDDYASTTKIPVLVPRSDETIFHASGEAHSCTEAMNGEFVDITDADTINGGANSLEVIKVEEYISATEMEFSLPRKSGVAASTNAD